MQRTLQYSSDLSDTELLNQNSAGKIKRDIRRFLSSAKQAGLTPQHALEIKGSHLDKAHCWGDAYKILQLASSRARRDANLDSNQVQTTGPTCSLSSRGGRNE